LLFTPSGFNNEKILLEWIEKILLPFTEMKIKGGEQVILLLGSASFQSTKKVRKALETGNVSLILLPGGCTDFLQRALKGSKGS
jgi:hypothetical protein